MKIDVKCNCPVCKRPAKLVYFKVRVGEMTELEFICRTCHVYFRSQALQVQIRKGKVTFTGLSGPIEVIWRDQNFNPSER